MQEAKRGTYGARDVVNAPAIKDAIRQRSRQRGDTEETAAWLFSHFFRYVVGNFRAQSEALREITSLDQVADLLHPAPVPEWVRARLKGGDATPQALWWIDPQGEALLALEGRLVEFLGSRAGTSLEGKLMRINCMQALAQWEAEHAQFEARAAAGWQTHHPDAVRVVWQGRQGVFVEMLPDSPQLRAEMAYESQMMRHCLGQFADRRRLSGGYGEHYASACESGKLRLFSYRTGQAHPHITISAEVTDLGLRVDQIKGKQNRPPVARYHDEVLDFLNSLDTADATPADAARMGMVRVPAGWRYAAMVGDETDQLHVVARHPALVQALPRPSAFVQWFVAAREPQFLEGLALAPGVAEALRSSQ